MAEAVLGLVEQSVAQANLILGQRSKSERKDKGQFMTPASVARFMASRLGPICDGDTILDPAIGSGTLACAVVERVIRTREASEIWVEGFDVDRQLCELAQGMLGELANQAQAQGIKVGFRVTQADFIREFAPRLNQLDLWGQGLGASRRSYEHVISNPPYFKLNSSDPRMALLKGQLSGSTNIYTVFMALALEALADLGRACFIIPRGFCSGTYFSAFREEFVRKAAILSLHIFNSRTATFKQDSVLQENVIITFQRRDADEVAGERLIEISASSGGDALARPPQHRQVRQSLVFHDRHRHFSLRVPTGELDERIVETLDQWKDTLGTLGLRASTGPVVSFRAKKHLSDAEMVKTGDAVPLLLLHNVRRGEIKWPRRDDSKPQGILKSAGDLLVPVDNYVLVRRFSAKEEPRRLVSAPFLRNSHFHDLVGLENHLNYIYGVWQPLSKKRAIGLSAYLNSAIADRYFRILNGNTQVNATELRSLPLPPAKIIDEIGHLLLEQKSRAVELDPNRVVFGVLRESGCIAPDFPTIKETRITMGKIQEAQEVLRMLGLPPAQQNELSALTFLTLAGLGEDSPWTKAKRQSFRIHDILVSIRDNYDREYAENTRESVRRQVIHQLEQAGVVVRNPDDPTLATNSPRTHYALTDPVIATIRRFGTANWEEAVQSFIDARGALLQIYQQRRDQEKIPLRLSDGSEYLLSPGEHNELQEEIINEFGPRFAPNAVVIYVGDTANKSLHIDEPIFHKLGVALPSHDKLPDVVLYDEKRNWLFLIEAVTSHGPVSPKRYVELEEVFRGCPAGRVYVTAFPDFATFRSFAADIAWETEVWLAEMPSHLVHYNGDRFLGPHRAD